MDLVILLILLAGSSALVGQERTANDSRVVAPRIQWSRHTGVSRYRVQIAADERFNDVIFDGVVNGNEYLARDLDPGHYYWRVAAADYTRRRILVAGEFEVSEIKVEKPQGSLVSAPAKSVDWLAATGEISNPLAAPLRESDFDFIGTNGEGTVYALDSLTGTTLWMARYSASAKPGATTLDSKGFVPVIAKLKDGSRLVIVAFEKGLRALESVRGQEVWATELPTGMVAGVAVEFSGMKGSQISDLKSQISNLTSQGPGIYLTNDKLNKLFCLEARTGRVRFEKKLNGKPSGPPVVLNMKSLALNMDSPVLLVPLQGNVIEVRNRVGDLIRSITLGAELTTAPIVAETLGGVLMLVGTEYGLITFDASNLQPLMRFEAAGNDYPTGSLSVADLDGDKSAESVVMITKLGRVAAINLSSGKLKWSADGFVQAASVAFADLNGDGLLDVLVPSNDNFAVGLSGIDGAQIWESTGSNQRTRSAKFTAHTRRLATVTSKNGRIIVAGNDSSAMGLRALELRTRSAAAAAK